MPMPADVGVVDAMIGFPSADPQRHYDPLTSQLRDAASEAMRFPTEYMFKEAPGPLDAQLDPVAATVAEMDRYGITLGLVGLGTRSAARALAEHPDRFRATVEIDPNDIAEAVAAIRGAHEEHAVVAVTTFPAGCNPQVPISDRRYYPVYQVCVDLGLPIVVNAGIAGPRVPSACQDVMHFDQVCYDFPDLVVVMRHGAEPWEELAVKLMLKWPGLHYMTSAFAPRYYPRAVIDYANTRGTHKVLYAGYFPWGLSLERIFAELPTVPLRDHVWRPFLRDNAVRVFKLGG